MLNRRLFFQALAGTGVTVSGVAAAQTPAKTYRLGHLTIGRADGAAGPSPDPFVTELARLGLIEGVNLVIDRRSARGNPTMLDGPAAELVALRPDVLISWAGFVGAQALKKATSRIPIVFGGVGEPVAAGLVASLARPGGNITGIAITDLDLKRVQILLEVVGTSATVAMLTTPIARGRMAGVAAAVSSARLPVRYEEIREREDIGSAFERMARQKVAGVVVANSTLTGSLQPEIAALALKHRLPGIGEGFTFTDHGLMLSYSIDWLDVARMAADYINKILKGVQPAELPVELASKFEFSINMKTVRALDVRLPASVRIAATRVINE